MRSTLLFAFLTIVLTASCVLGNPDNYGTGDGDIRGKNAQANMDEYDGGMIDEYHSKIDGKMGLGDGRVGKKLFCYCKFFSCKRGWTNAGKCSKFCLIRPLCQNRCCRYVKQ
ncbi:hypothetical protein DPMN_181099 [Dreissena polymorpha]|uniref:Uncharacterized protein n=1 Tax=Dreissena polymorpha TaxID=45954 RepID=A0A9D4DCV8_DREPO|nr:hypothetical protein DPMN_181099 [Dreissena polymorpha]